MNRQANYCECGNHAWLPLTQGFVTLIDPEFASVASLWSWHAHKNRGNVYARRNHHGLYAPWP